MKISYGRVQTLIALLIWAQSTSVTNGQTDMPFRGVAGWKYVGWTDIGERGGRAYNWGLGAEPPAGSRDRAPGQGVRGRSPPEAENLLASGCATEAENLPHSPQFANSLNPRHLWYKNIFQKTERVVHDGMYNVVYDRPKKCIKSVSSPYS